MLPTLNLKCFGRVAQLGRQYNVMAKHCSFSGQSFRAVLAPIRLNEVGLKLHMSRRG